MVLLSIFNKSFNLGDWFDKTRRNWRIETESSDTRSRVKNWRAETPKPWYILLGNSWKINKGTTYFSYLCYSIFFFFSYIYNT